MTKSRSRAHFHPGPNYRWLALSNTTLGVLAATLNSSILLISLPPIFRGIDLDPLAPANINYLLWIIMGYMIATSVLVVTCGRLGDIYGRARIYHLGFVIFTAAAIALNFIPGIGGSFLGLLVGGLLADWDWRLVFWVNVPVGVIGTAWALWKLREV